MAGHSKWANIKHRKASQDAKRGKLFTKLIHDLTVAAKSGGNIDDNPSLRSTVEKALNANMTRDTINRAISRGVGGGKGSNMNEIIYEGYGANGIAILVECLTDNKNRTVAEVRHGFSKYGGNLGSSGSVSYLFTKKGLIYFEPGVDSDAILELALEIGVDDFIENEDKSVEIYVDWVELNSTKEALEKSGYKTNDAEVTMLPKTTTSLDKECEENILKLISHLESLNDVQNVYTTADIDGL